MPNIQKILETMREQGIPEKTISKFTLPKAKAPKPREVVEFIEQMDTLLSSEQCLFIMGEQGCYKTDRVSAEFRTFGETYKNKTLAQRVALLPELDSPHRVQCLINDDGTITLKFGFDSEQGVLHCLCSTVKKLGAFAVPLTYCGCCGGHIKYTHEFALGVKLRLKKIVSSIANSDGKKPCEFIYEIAD